MKRCGECGSQNLKLKNIKGTVHPWRDFLNVELLCDQNAFVCEECGNTPMTSKDITHLEKNIRSSLVLKIKKFINKLVEAGFNQGEISAALGTTPEYLSMVKNGKKALSYTTFNMLQAFSDNPELITKYTGVVPSKPKEKAFFIYEPEVVTFSRLSQKPRFKARVTKIDLGISNARTIAIVPFDSKEKNETVGLNLDGYVSALIKTAKG